MSGHLGSRSTGKIIERFQSRCGVTRVSVQLLRMDLIHQTHTPKSIKYFLIAIDCDSNPHIQSYLMHYWKWSYQNEYELSSLHYNAINKHKEDCNAIFIKVSIHLAIYKSNFPFLIKRDSQPLRDRSFEFQFLTTT